jgi:hypothetical protein
MALLGDFELKRNPQCDDLMAVNRRKGIDLPSDPLGIAFCTVTYT